MSQRSSSSFGSSSTISTFFIKFLAFFLLFYKWHPEMCFRTFPQFGFQRETAIVAQKPETRGDIVQTYMSYGELRDIEVSYDKKNLILKDLNLDIRKGELLSLLGPSGCGKTTTLRVIAGLMDTAAGSFVLDGQDMGIRRMRK